MSVFERGGENLEAMVLVVVFLAIAFSCCWLLVRDTDREIDDAEQEEYLKKWMEEKKK